MLLPFRSRAEHVIFGANSRVRRISWLRRDIILIRRCGYRVTIKRAWWNGANEKKGGWIIHPLASISIAVKNWVANAHDR